MSYTGLFDPLAVWKPAIDKPNVLVVARERSSIAIAAEHLGEHDFPMQVGCVPTPIAGLCLLSRSTFAVIVVDLSSNDPGLIESLVESLARPQAPRLLLLHPRFKSVADFGSLRLLPGSLAQADLENQVRQGCREFLSGAPSAVSPLDFLRAVRHSVDAAWLRVTHGSQCGDFCLSNGRIVYSECGPLSGESAARKILEWGPSTFEYREIPGFLNSNLSLDVSEVLDGPNGSVFNLPASTSPASTGRDASDVEEPTEFLSFDSFDSFEEEPAGTLETMQADFPFREEEPENMPVFESGYDECSLADSDFEEPMMFPEFHVSPLASTVFASVVVISNGLVVSAEPSSDAEMFDPILLSLFYEQAKQVAEAHRLPPGPAVILAGSDSIAVAAAGRADRLVAVRFAGPFFDAPQQAELARLADGVRSGAIAVLPAA